MNPKLILCTAKHVYYHIAKWVLVFSDLILSFGIAHIIVSYELYSYLFLILALTLASVWLHMDPKF